MCTRFVEYVLAVFSLVWWPEAPECETSMIEINDLVQLEKHNINIHSSDTLHNLALQRSCTVYWQTSVGETQNNNILYNLSLERNCTVYWRTSVGETQHNNTLYNLALQRNCTVYLQASWNSWEKTIQQYNWSPLAWHTYEPGKHSPNWHQRWCTLYRLTQCSRSTNRQIHFPSTTRKNSKYNTGFRALKSWIRVLLHINLQNCSRKNDGQ